MNIGKEEVEIKSIIDSKVNKKWFLPDIQREFVWLRKPSENKIENFIESLLKKYPVGSFLTWTTSKQNTVCKICKFKSVYKVDSPHYDYQDTDIIEDNTFSLVLDGQQRITALNIAFKGGLEKDLKRDTQKKELYINISHKPNRQDPSDKYELKFLTTAQVAKDIEMNKKWFPVKNLLLDTDHLNEVIQNYTEKERDFIKDLSHYILDVKFNVYTVENASLDEAVEIFVRVNSGGQALQKTDLLMSFIAAKFKGDIRERINKLVDNWNDEGFKKFDSDKFLRTCMLMIGKSAKLSVASFTKRQDGEEEPAELILHDWANIVKNIDQAIGILKTLHYDKKEIYTDIISVLALYCKKHKLTREEYKDIIEFILRVQLTEYFGSSADTKLEWIRSAIGNANTFKDILLDDKVSRELRVTEDIIEDAVKKANYNNSLGLMLLQILFPQIDYSRGSFHIDHIYPKDKFEDHGYTRQRAHQIANLQMLPGLENQEKLVKDPQVWLDEQYPNQNDQIKFRQEQFLPDFPLTWDKMDEFEKKRKELLIEELKKRFGLNSKR